jgi:hypothetical protein
LFLSCNGKTEQLRRRELDWMHTGDYDASSSAPYPEPAPQPVVQRNASPYGTSCLGTDDATACSASSTCECSCKPVSQSTSKPTPAPKPSPKPSPAPVYD